jgi:hypothetical protein
VSFCCLVASLLSSWKPQYGKYSSLSAEAKAYDCCRNPKAMIRKLVKIFAALPVYLNIQLLWDVRPCKLQGQVVQRLLHAEGKGNMIVLKVGSC